MPALTGAKMQRHSFTVEVTGINLDNDDYDDGLYEAGCRDALAIVTDGRLSLDFDRMATSFGSAVESAIRDVSKIGGVVTNIKKIRA